MADADQVSGTCDDRFARVRDVFTEHFARGEELGAAVAVYSGDDLVVDLWGGVADRKTGRPWLRDTPCLAFSCTKAVTAAAALRLADAKAYDLSAPVTTWWPEYGTHGKQDTTAEHLLSHQAGLPAFDADEPAAIGADPAAAAAKLAEQAPVWEPGTDHGYHAITYGWLAGEIVRRHAGKGVGAYVAEEIAGPSGLELWLGAPPEVIERAAKMSAARRGGGSGQAAPLDPATLEGPYRALAEAAQDPRSLMNRALYNPRVAEEPGGWNNPAVLAAGWPAAGLMATARGLAGLYRDLLAPGRIVRWPTLVDAVVRRVAGPDRVLHIDTSFGLGFMRPSSAFLTPAAGRDSAFGHTGAGGSVGLADIERGVSIAYVMNRMGEEVSGGLRAYRLIEALYASLD
ncbi:MAG: serine hydrolase [Streptosporangiales bacterium]|nr:serine hydrolase [Streptosporangiales bacterium]